MEKEDAKNKFFFTTHCQKLFLVTSKVRELLFLVGESGVLDSEIERIGEKLKESSFKAREPLYHTLLLVIIASVGTVLTCRIIGSSRFGN